MSKFTVSIIMKISILLICIYLSTTDGSINYCGAKMCSYTDTHTFCQYPPGPGPSCLGYIESPLSGVEKVRVLARLNRRRSEAAHGLRGLPSAGDMLKLRWVEELAREAQRWADQCRPPRAKEENDLCRDLYSTSVGQCVASVVGEAPGLKPESMVDMWYMQSVYYLGNVTTYIPDSNGNHFYGDFAQMTWSRTYMVGCGRSRFMTPWSGRLRSVERLVCNFAPRGPNQFRALWSPAPPSTLCPTRSRPDPEIPGLCAFQNNLNVEDEMHSANNTMTLEEHLLLSAIMEIEKNILLDEIGVMDELYLKNIAVATFENFITTALSVRRFIFNNDSSEGDIDMSITSLPIMFYDEISVTHLNINKKSHRKKINLLGRPKPYNIEELSEVKHYENSNVMEEVAQTHRKVYDENDYFEISEINTENPSNASETGHFIMETTINNQSEINLNDTQEIQETINRTNVLEKIVDEIVKNVSPSDRNELEIDDKVVDDYLSDPETFQQLQDAINRMEQKLASSKPISGKVRRELRNLEEDRVKNLKKNTHDSIKAPNEENGALPKEIDFNKTKERGPMINMMLKYMPYLKEYENTILGSSSSEANVVASSSITVFIKLHLLKLCY